MFLAKHGVPWDVAEGLDAETRFAMVVIAIEHEGGRFDWNTGQWQKPK